MRQQNNKTVINGIPVEVVSDEEAETVDYLVCVTADTPTKFTDNFKGVCCHCGVAIVYRWHAPRKPKKICMKCVVELGEQGKLENSGSPAR